MYDHISFVYLDKTTSAMISISSLLHQEELFPFGISREESTLLWRDGNDTFDRSIVTAQASSQDASRNTVYCQNNTPK